VAALAEGPIDDLTTETLTISIDGIEVPAYHARPDGMPDAGVVLHPDIMGLRPLFEDMARRLASHGFAVVVVEPFATIDGWEALTSVEQRFAAIPAMRDEQQIGALETAGDQLVIRDDVTRIGVLGFCMGGYMTLKAAAGDRFDRAVAFYGMIRTPEAWRGAGLHDPLDTAADVCPTLAIFGTNDSFVPNDDVDELRRVWAGRPDCEIVQIEGAEHGFVHDPDRPIHRADDAARLWDRTIGWLRA
jgi:carboxymethylenebutenolidase